MIPINSRNGNICKFGICKLEMAGTLKHVMISYSWKQQPFARRLSKLLSNNGIPVWIDEERMQGDIFNAMIQAVDQAFTVIICASSDYEKSENCKLEGQRAITKKRTRTQVIPVIAEAGYKLSDWLAFAMPGELYYDMSSDVK